MHPIRVTVAVAALLVVTGCQDGAPERAPDIVGVIEQVNMGVDRVNTMVIHQLQTPGNVERIQLNIDSKTKVVWYVTGKDVVSHHQNIRIGRTVRGWAKSGLIENDPPEMNVSRIELSSVNNGSN